MRFEKILYFYCAMNDLIDRCTDGKAALKLNGEELDETVLRQVSQILAAKLAAGEDSPVAKVCFATLTRESKRQPENVNKVLHEAYEQS